MREKAIVQASLVRAPDRNTEPRHAPRQANGFVGLQQMLGNQAMLYLLTSGAIQAKLRVSQPGDADELEADCIADRVVSTTEQPAIHRKCNCEGGVASCPACEEEEVEQAKGIHRKPKASSGESESVEADFLPSLSVGKPLDSSIRSSMESRFGRNFSNVRIHTDDQADRAARQINAVAFTHESDIYIGNGIFNPTSEAGKRVLAHELTHVVQQSSLQASASSGEMKSQERSQRSHGILQRQSTEEEYKKVAQPTAEGVEPMSEQVELIKADFHGEGLIRYDRPVSATQKISLANDGDVEVPVKPNSSGLLEIVVNYVASGTRPGLLGPRGPRLPVMYSGNSTTIVRFDATSDAQVRLTNDPHTNDGQNAETPFSFTTKPKVKEGGTFVSLTLQAETASTVSTTASKSRTTQATEGRETSSQTGGEGGLTKGPLGGKLTYQSGSKETGARGDVRTATDSTSTSKDWDPKHSWSITLRVPSPPKQASPLAKVGTYVVLFDKNSSAMHSKDGDEKQPLRRWYLGLDNEIRQGLTVVGGRFRLRLLGMADNTGGDDFNVKLSEKRIRAVLETLYGIAPGLKNIPPYIENQGAVLTSDPHGKDNPILRNVQIKIEENPKRSPGGDKKSRTATPHERSAVRAFGGEAPAQARCLRRGGEMLIPGHPWDMVGPDSGIKDRDRCRYGATHHGSSGWAFRKSKVMVKTARPSHPASRIAPRTLSRKSQH